MVTMIVGSYNTMLSHVGNNIDKEGESSTWNEVSERTMGLEEDELMMMGEDNNDPSSQLCSDFVRISCVEEEEEDINSCSNVVDDEIHSTCSATTRVKFSPIVTECLTMSLDEYTQDEMEETWWTHDEMEVMNEEQYRIAGRLEAGLKEDKESSPYRGLEGRASACHEHVMETRKACVDTVVSEQERQWNEKRSLLDWEKIASLAKEMTKQSTQEALLIASYDENEARVAYLQMVDNLQRSGIVRSTKGPVVSPKNTKNKKQAKGLKPYCSRILSLMKKH